MSHPGFLALVLQRCVLSDGVSEDLRVAGLRAASVFMARSAKICARDAATGFIKVGNSMSAKGEPCGDTDCHNLPDNRPW